jgi:hypothetical protein
MDPGGGEQRRADRGEFLDRSSDCVGGEKDVRVEVQAGEGCRAPITLVERASLRGRRHFNDVELVAACGKADDIRARSGRGLVGGTVDHHNHFEVHSCQFLSEERLE